VGAYENRTILGKKEKIFLTGHTGFKGTWLTLLLEAMGHEVVGYSLAPAPDSLYERLCRTGAIQEFIADIRDVDAVNKAMQAAKPTIVIHMAAQPLVLESYRIPRETFEINAQGTANVLEAAFAVGTAAVIGAVTTDKVYKNLETQYSYVETDALEGSSDPYSASKVAAEAVISGWKKISDVSGGPKIVTLRSGNVIGGGDYSADRLIPDLVRSHLSGKPIQVRNPNSTRPWTHVLDSLIGYLKAIDYTSKNGINEVFNFAPTGMSLSVKEVLDISLQEWPGICQVKILPEAASKSEANLLSLNSNKSSKLLNWKPCWSQESAVRSTIKWWEEVLSLEATPKSRCELDIERVLNHA
jgi:CDP-glucose 4,6-dehydratase